MAKITPQAPEEPVVETKVEHGTEPLVKAQPQKEPIKKEVLKDGTIVEHY